MTDETRQAAAHAHDQRFDGDSPYLICHGCGTRWDALTGREIKPFVAQRAPSADGLRAALSRANLRELAEEAIEGGYRTVEVPPQLVLDMLAMLAAIRSGAGPLPSLTPIIPGLDISSAVDLLTPEAKAELDKNLRDNARTQRQARASAATILLAGAASPPRAAGSPEAGR